MGTNMQQNRDGAWTPAKQYQEHTRLGGIAANVIIVCVIISALMLTVKLASVLFT